MAGNLTVETCGNTFSDRSRKASSNYGIGTDGRIGLYVDESNRSWASSNGSNDRQAVTIEVANSSVGGDWPVSQQAWESLVNLCVDICQRNGMPGLAWTGDSKGTLTCHYMFTSTQCPGPYLKSRMAQLANEVNAKLDNGWIPVAPSGGTFAWGDLYSTKNTREDAVAREVLYEDNNKLVTYSTRDKISVGNYTDVFAELWNLGKTMLAPIYNADGLEGNAKLVVEYFMNKGYTAAAGCGVAGNIKSESSFRTDAVGDYGTSFGICQWHLGRGENMKKFCGGGDNWKNNLTGQLDYLHHELCTSYRGVLSVIESAQNTESDARHVADVFVRKFEIPANVDYQSKIRQQNAVDYFNSLSFSIGHPLSRK